jgi:transmembrane sensor
VSALKSPLHTVAPVPVDDVTARRLYHGVLARRASRKSDATRWLALRWALLGAMAGTLLTIGAEWMLAKRAVVAAAAAQGLTHVDGTSWGLTVAPASGSALSSFSDGSQVLLQAGARLEPLENTGHAVSLLLAQGRATFDVHPGGPRRWTIECGLVTVEVVGTRFTVDRTPERVAVTVERGVVLVRGERVPDRVQRLGAGQAIEVRAEATHAAVAPAPSLSAAVPRAPQRAAWRELSTRGDYAGAYRLLGADGVDAESTESRRVDDLMALADVARLSGHPAEATGPLARVVREFAKDPRASLAAFTLGKIHLASTASAGLAAKDFTDALRLGLPSSLVEDAHANRIEALRRTGDDTAARAAAIEYAARFPASERARALRTWAESR